MPKVRVFYDKSGKVVEVERRVDETYTPENIAREQMEEISTLVVESDELEGVAIEELRVRDDKIRKGRHRTAQDLEVKAAQRIREILEIDKSKLSDEEWLKLFREYTTLTGNF